MARMIHDLQLSIHGKLYGQKKLVQYSAHRPSNTIFKVYERSRMLEPNTIFLHSWNCRLTFFFLYISS